VPILDDADRIAVADTPFLLPTRAFESDTDMPLIERRVADAEKE
jgi:hypothetical protein